MYKGTLYVISAPSGAGKTSLVRALRETVENLTVSISHTTRPMRAGERDAVDYFFVDHAQFERMVASGDFLEHATVFGNYYGTARTTVETDLHSGKDVILEIDWQGARQIRKQIPACRSIFIVPPSRESLEQRLRARGQDDDETISRRMREAISEISHFDEYDDLLVNDDFQTALNELRSIVIARRMSRLQQQERHRALLAALLR